MKRLITFLAVILSITTCWAASPRLACESLFTEDVYKNPAVNMSIITKRGEVFRSLTVNGDSKLISRIEAAVDKDKKLSEEVTESYTNGGAIRSVIFTVRKGNGYNVEIIYSKRGDKKASLAIQGKPKAFE